MWKVEKRLTICVPFNPLPLEAGRKVRIATVQSWGDDRIRILLA